MAEPDDELGGVEPAVTEGSLARLRTADLSSGELESSLRMIVGATSEIFSADGAGVMLLDDRQALHYVGATSGKAAALEAAQEETGQGPCIDSLLLDEMVHTEDLANDERWPKLRSAIGDLGVRAILGVPLHLGPTAVGSLNVYHHSARRWHEGDVRAIQAHGRVVEELLGAAVLAQQRSTIVDQLNSALLNRVVIERAIGVVMHAQDLDAVRAFDALRRAARARRVKVASLAEHVVATRSFTPDGDA